MQRLWPLLALVGSHVSTVLVLGLLGGIAWFGIHNDWKIPKLSDLWGQKSEPKQDGEKEDQEELPPGRIRLASDEVARQAGIEYGMIEKKPVPQIVTAPGEVDFDPARYVRVSTRADGHVREVYKQVGDRVAVGEVLAVVDAAEVGKAKLELLKALVLVDTRAQALRRLESAPGAAPESQRIEAKAALREADTQLRTQQEILLSYGLSVKPDDLLRLSDAEARRQLRVLGLPSELTSSSEADSLSMNLLPLRSPLEGVVLQRNVARGERVTLLQSQAPFVIADLSRVWVLLSVHREFVPLLDLKGGQRVTFHTDAHDDRPQGQEENEAPAGVITWISPEVDEKTHTVRVRVPLDNPKGRLRANTFGTGHIVVRETARALTVPNEALQWDGGAYFVFVKLSETEFEARQVLPGVRGATHTEVRSPWQAIASRKVNVRDILSVVSLFPGPLVQSGIRVNEEVATVGSHALKSELFKDRLGGDD